MQGKKLKSTMIACFIFALLLCAYAQFQLYLIKPPIDRTSVKLNEVQFFSGDFSVHQNGFYRIFLRTKFPDRQKSIRQSDLAAYLFGHDKNSFHWELQEEGGVVDQGDMNAINSIQATLPDVLDLDLGGFRASPQHHYRLTIRIHEPILNRSDTQSSLTVSDHYQGDIPFAALWQLLAAFIGIIGIVCGLILVIRSIVNRKNILS